MSDMFKVQFKPKEYYGTPLDSDTLFGHICWAIRYVFSEEKLTQMLKLFNSEKPTFLISSAFPTDYIPKPVFPSIDIDYNPEQPKAQMRKNRENTKKQKKNRLIKISEFHKYQQNSSANDVYSINEELGIGIFGITRNAIDRRNLQVTEGALFNDQYYYQDFSLTSYIQSFDNDYNESFFEKIFEYLEDTGIGKKKSIGKGHFKINIEPLNDIEKNIFNYKGNYFISLSHSAGQNLHPVSYKIFTRYGKLGEEYATKGVFYKKPVLFYEHGALFKTKSDQDFYGETIKNIATIKDVIQYGYCFPLYTNIKDTI